MISTKDIKYLYGLFEGSDIGEVEIHSEGAKLRLALGGEKKSAPAPAPAPVATSQDKKSSVSSESELPPNVVELKSKWVGFFTRLNPKTGEYYVKLRDKVSENDIIAHVRVLGVLQDVKAGMNGKVKEILVEEGQPIEYGQPLLRFEK